MFIQRLLICFFLRDLATQSIRISCVPIYKTCKYIWLLVPFSWNWSFKIPSKHKGSIVHYYTRRRLSFSLTASLSEFHSYDRSTAVFTGFPGEIRNRRTAVESKISTKFARSTRHRTSRGIYHNERSSRNDMTSQQWQSVVHSHERLIIVSRLPSRRSSNDLRVLRQEG